jgi:ferritin-like metal-binding protein YciE
MALNSLKDLYVEQLQDLYDAEQQILKALPKLAKAANAPELQQAFQEHEKQTRMQAQRLEQIFQEHGMPAKAKTCKAMRGLLDEGEETMKMKADPEVLDAALIAAAQRVEHYEIAGYGTARTYAQQLGNTRGAQLLQQTLDEEGMTDKKLTQLAERKVNVRAQ